MAGYGESNRLFAAATLSLCALPMRCSQANPYLYEDETSGKTMIDLSGSGGQVVIR